MQFFPNSNFFYFLKSLAGDVFDKGFSYLSSTFSKAAFMQSSALRSSDIRVVGTGGKCITAATAPPAEDMTGHGSSPRSKANALADGRCLVPMAFSEGDTLFTVLGDGPLLSAYLTPPARSSSR